LTFPFLHISLGGPDRKIRDEAGKIIKFEDHPRFGPQVLNANGSIKENQPGSRASFWRVVTWWYAQGKQIDADGYCVWTAPAPLKMEHIGGRHYRLVLP